jgi:molecular chaperone GrpE
VKNQEDKPEPIDINLDAEPIGESPLADAARALMEEAAAAAVAPAPVPAVDGVLPGELQALMNKIKKLQADKDEQQQTLVRRQADFENFRKRIERERQEDNRRAIGIVAEGLLPILDAFERALAAPVEPGFEQHRIGYEMIYKQLWEALARNGLERIEAAGKAFDPFVHQAIERVETADHEDGTVLEEFQRGYKIRDRILRPSMVRVAVNSGATPAGADTTVN